MAAERIGTGNVAGRSGTDRAEEVTAAPTRLVTRAAQAAATEADPFDQRYDFLDDRETEFKWRPASGGEQAGEGEIRTAPAWVKRSRAHKSRSILKTALASVLTLAVIAFVATAAYFFMSGRFGTVKPAPVETKASSQPAVTAPAPVPAAATAAPNAVQPAPAQPENGESAAGAERPVAAPPGGEDGPPAPAQSEQTPR